MQGLLLLIIGKIVEVMMKYLIEWSEKSISRQQEIKKRLEEIQAKRKEAEINAKSYEANPTADNLNKLP